MAFFGYLPVPRLLPYEAEPYDLPPVPGRDPSQLDEAGAQRYRPPLVPFMPLAPRHYALGQAFDPGSIHFAQSLPGSSGTPQPAPSRPSPATLLHPGLLSQLPGLYLRF